VSIHLLDEEKYIEDGYIDTSYFGGLLEGQGLFTPYFEEGYIEEGYIDNAGMAFVLTADLTLAIEQGAADLSSSFAFAATVGKQKLADASLVANSSVEVTGIRSAGLAADLQCEVAVSSTGNAIRSAVVSITDAFTPQITAVATRDVDIDLVLETTMSTQAVITASAESLLEYFADLSAQYNLIRESPVSATAEFSVGHTDESLGLLPDVLPAVDFEGAAVLVCTAAMTTAGNLIAGGSADTVAVFSTDISSERIRDNDSDLDCITDITIDAGIIKQGAAELDAFYSQLTAGGRVSDFFINCDLVSQLSVSPVAVFSGDATASVVAQTTVTGARTRSTTAAFTAVFSTATEFLRIRNSSAEVGAASTVTAVGDLIKDFDSAISVTTALTVDLDRIKLFSSDLNSEFDILISTNRIQKISANLQGVFVFDFEGQVLSLPRVVYMVPREIRLWQIQNEIRIYSIQGDS